MKSAVSALLILLLISMATKAHTFCDDRTSPETLIRSLYSAITQHEYARA